MQVAHIAFTYLRLTLIYFHLECKILVKIPDSVLDYALERVYKGKRRGYSDSKTISLAM